jgi:putative ABC transport system substrate-binding protein
MRRREFIGLIGGAAATWPLAARTQQVAMPIVGFLNAQTAAGFQHLVAAFKHGLNEVGFVEGQNVAIEYRWADGHPDQLPMLVDELVRLHVAVIVATGGAHAEAKITNAGIPVVASFGGDPIRLGYVASLNRPGGNVTGMTVFTADLEAKRMELLHELVPKGSLGVLLDPTTMDGVDLQRQAVKTAALAIGREIRFAEAGTDADLEQALTTLAEAHVVGVDVSGSPLFNNRRNHILALTARLALPAIYENREFTAAGGLMSYGTNVPDVYRQIGVYAGRVLKGEKPADLPVLQPDKFDIAVNRKTAKALGLEFPTSILLRANEVIE